MKKVITLLFLQCFFVSLKAQDSQDTGYMIYVDSLYENASMARKPHYSRLARLSLHNQGIAKNQLDTMYSRKHMMMAIYDLDFTEFTDGVIHCLRMAMDLWEDRINFKFPIVFFVNYTYDLDDDLEIRTVVKYSRLSRFQSRSNSLYSWYNNLPENLQANVMEISPDTISINANVDWNSAWSYDINGTGSNLITSLLRHIGHILGFGCSVITENGTTRFTISGAASDFDRLIVDNNNIALSSYCGNQTALISSGFFTHSLKLNTTNQYALYNSESGFVPFRSAMYFSLPTDNIMNYPYGDRSQLRNINHETLDALKSIGWGQRVSPFNVVIHSTTLDDAGYGSSYATQLFCAADIAGNGVQSAAWKYQRFSNAAGDYVDVTTFTGSTFSLSPPSAVSDAIDEYACLQGRVVCTLTNGGVQTSYTKPVFLELRPWFKSLTVENVNAPANSNYFSFDVRIKSLGATSGQLLVCNEYGQVQSYNMSGVNEEVIHVSNAFKFGQTYFDVTLSNSYGDNVKVIPYEEEIGTVRQQAVESSMATTKLRIIPVEGEIVEERLFVQDNDFVSLKLSDVNDEPVEVSKDTQTRWQLVIPKGRDRYWECDLGGDSQGCSFRMSPYFVGGRADMLECVWDDETDNVYNDGVIRATMKKGDQVVGNAEFPIRLNVLPSMPQVAPISSGEEYDDEYGRFIPIYYLRISAKGYITGYVFSNGNMGQVFFADEPMPMTLRIDWAYPNCFFSCSLHNDYGWTKSPPFFAEFTGIDQHEYGQFSIKQHNGICLIDLGHTMDHALIADLNGKTWCSLHNVNHIELPLPTGVYLLRLKDGKSNNTIKIVIK